MIPVTITPQLGDNGIDHYWLMISAQNGTVDETLDFRQAKKSPGTYAMRLGVTKRFKIDKNSNASIPVLVREWTDEGGAEQKLPDVDISLRLLKRAAKKATLKSGGWDRLLNWVAHPLAFGISKGAVFSLKQRPIGLAGRR